VIGRLTGVATDRGLDGCCVLDVRGVGYELFVPLRTARRLAPPPDEVTLHVHTHVREDALMLYGFATLDDRKAFRSMLAVSGVGPKLALAILGELSAAELAEAIARGDRKRFSGISGVGKKTAERLVLELEGKLGVPAGSVIDLPVPRAGDAINGQAGEVVSALIRLGFSRGEAEQAVARIAAPADATQPLEVLLRQALSSLA
jgi:Holliday junction DNA helicase RuvA